MTADGGRAGARSAGRQLARAAGAARGRPAGRARRRIAIASFRPSRDGRIYARIALDASPVLAYVERTRERTGVPVTITHVVAAALARAVSDVPEVRTRVLLGRAVPIPGVTISFTVDVGAGSDLAPVRVEDADRRTPVELAQAMLPAVERTRRGEQRAHRVSSAWARTTPWWALRPGLDLAGWLFSAVGVPAFGQPAFPLGVALVSNVGPLGIEEAFLAPMPAARVPLYLSVGAVHDAAMPVGDRVEVRPQLVLVATGDHRLIDGAHAGRIVTTLRLLLQDPERLDDPRP